MRASIHRLAKSGRLAAAVCGALLLAGDVVFAEPASSSDTCRSIIPDEIIAPLAKRFPGLRLPKMSDLAYVEGREAARIGGPSR